MNLAKGSRAVTVSYAVIYHSSEAMKQKYELDEALTRHSFWIGSANKGTKLGVSRSLIKEAGM